MTALTLNTTSEPKLNSCWTGLEPRTERRCSWYLPCAVGKGCWGICLLFNLPSVRCAAARVPNQAIHHTPIKHCQLCPLPRLTVALVPLEKKGLPIYVIRCNAGFVCFFFFLIPPVFALANRVCFDEKCFYIILPMLPIEVNIFFISLNHKLF